MPLLATSRAAEPAKSGRRQGKRQLSHALHTCSGHVGGFFVSSIFLHTGICWWCGETSQKPLLLQGLLRTPHSGHQCAAIHKGHTTGIWPAGSKSPIVSYWNAVLEAGGWRCPSLCTHHIFLPFIYSIWLMALLVCFMDLLGYRHAMLNSPARHSSAQVLTHTLTQWWCETVCSFSWYPFQYPSLKASQSVIKEPRVIAVVVGTQRQGEEQCQFLPSVFPLL